MAQANQTVVGKHLDRAEKPAADGFLRERRMQGQNNGSSSGRMARIKKPCRWGRPGGGVLIRIWLDGQSGPLRT